MRKKLFFALVVLAAAAGVAGVFFIENSKVKTSRSPIPADVNGDLREHSKIFKKGVKKVCEGVYSAIGYGISNSIMLVGDDGLIIVDAMTTKQEAAEVLAEFRKISSKPIKAIIYTHSHPDHIFGAEVFAEGAAPDIYAHDTLNRQVQHLANEVRAIIGSRSMRMYGNYLPPDQVINVGIGPLVGIKPGSEMGFLKPNKVFSDVLEDEVAGIKFKLVHAPGETDDQIFVWLPNRKILLCGDNFYWTFPNLYTIRGTTFRSLKSWYKSLDKMRALKAEYLVPSHSRPIIGTDKIDRILTDYRDAIQYVHDQSIRGMNAGMTPDQLVDAIKLPPHLAKAPYLQPFYGKVSWSVRSVFAGNLGWFSGDSADLQPLSPLEKARLAARLAGGEDALLKHAKDLLAESNYQAALELSGYLIRMNPENQAARDIRIKSLTALGEKEENPNARSYYLSEALEVRDHFVAKDQTTPSPALLKSLPLSGYFDSLAVNLDPEKSADVNERVGMIFPDQNEAFLMHVRYGVAEMKPVSPEELDRMDLDIKVIAQSMDFKMMLVKLKGPLKTLAGFDYPKGNAVAFGAFMKLFAPPVIKSPYEPSPRI